jgi:hypothetical protein
MDNTLHKYSSTFVRGTFTQMSVELSDEAKINIQKCRDFLDKKMATHLNLSME